MTIALEDRGARGGRNVTGAGGGWWCASGFAGSVPGPVVPADVWLAVPLVVRSVVRSVV